VRNIPVKLWDAIRKPAFHLKISHYTAVAILAINVIVRMNDAIRNSLRGNPRIAEIISVIIQGVKISSCGIEITVGPMLAAGIFGVDSRGETVQSSVKLVDVSIKIVRMRNIPATGQILNLRLKCCP
jgi:hypothetical protein